MGSSNDDKTTLGETLKLIIVPLLLVGMLGFGSLLTQHLSAYFCLGLGIAYGTWVVGLWAGLFIKRWEAFAVSTVFAIPMLIIAIVKAYSS